MILTTQQIKAYRGRIKSIDAKLSIMGEGHKLVPIRWDGSEKITFGKHHGSVTQTEAIIPPYSDNMPGVQTRIEDSAFAGCEGLEKIKIMPKVEVDNFGKSAFQGCINLRTVILDFDMDSVPSNTFFNCTELRNIDLPSSVKSIGENAFYKCTALQTIGMKDSNLQKIDKNAFANCGIRAILLPDTLIKIGDNAFTNSGLNHIKLPNSVEFVGSSAFHSCGNLKDVVLSDKLVDLPSFCFDNCTKLSNVTIPIGRLNSIGDYAFNNCQKLDSLVIPEGVQKIGEHAFKGSGITRLELPGSLVSIKENDFGQNIEIVCKKNSDRAIKRIAKHENWNVRWV